MTFCYGSGSAAPALTPDPAIFVNDRQEGNKKLFFFPKLFCFLLFEGTYTSFSKDKKSQKNAKQQESRFSLLFLFDDRRIRNWIRIWEAQKHTDPKDPDQQHYTEHNC
jgi:hypothetical protein